MSSESHRGRKISWMSLSNIAVKVACRPGENVNAEAGKRFSMQVCRKFAARGVCLFQVHGSWATDIGNVNVVRTVPLQHINK